MIATSGFLTALECTKFCPGPRWGNLQRSPRPLAGLRGPTSKGTLRYVTDRNVRINVTLRYGFLRYVTLREGGKQAYGTLRYGTLRKNNVT